MIEVKNLVKAYRPKKGETVHALKGINLKFEEKGLVFILGKSGSGKSTLLNMLGGLDQFDDGEIIVKGKSSKEFAQADFDSYRNTFIGFIFQEYNILNDFTVGANIALAMELQGKKPTKENLTNILREVDLDGFGDRKPNELSGGQKQRVAIARALIKNPEIIMADEPTGALDSNTGKQVFDTLKRLSKDKLVIVVSHDREFAEQYGDRVIEMKDGEVISDIKKYTAKSSDINDGIQIINEKIIHIKSGYELTAEDMKMINDYLKKNQENDSFISLDLRTNDKIKQVAQIDEFGNQQAFKETTEEDLNLVQYDSSKLKLIKSKLPLKSSLKMAAGSLKKKPFRLIMTIMLSMVAFSLFGLVNTMSSYDKINSNTDSIIDSNVDYIAFSKENKVDYGSWSYYTSAKLSDEDITEIQQKFEDNVFTPVTNLNGETVDFGSNITDVTKLNPYGEFQYYPSYFNGAAVITEDTIENMGYELTGSLPAEETDIVITKVAAESFVMGGYTNPESSKKEKITNTAEMIGKKISLSLNNDKVYTITGILDTKFNGSRYEAFTKEQDPTASGMSVYMLQSELNTVRAYSYHNLVFTTESLFAQVAASNAGVTSWGSDYDIQLLEGETQYELNSIVELSKLNNSDANNVIYFDEKKTTLDSDEIIVSVSTILQNAEAYSALSGVDITTDLEKMIRDNADIFRDLAVQTSVNTMANNWEVVTKDVQIAGIFVDTDSVNTNTLIVPDGFLNEYGIQEQGTYTCVLGKMPTSRAGIETVVKYSYDNGIDNVNYSLKNCTSSLIDNVNTIVEEARSILLGIGIGFAIFAGLMLMNFITTSIAYRKREIGILRAVGARGRDVFMIFLQESCIIALINWALAIGATGFVVSFLNSMFRRNYNFVITVFHFGILQIILMLGLSLLVAFLACFFPVFNVSRKKPIEVIRKN